MLDLLKAENIEYKEIVNDNTISIEFPCHFNNVYENGLIYIDNIQVDISHLKNCTVLLPEEFNDLSNKNINYIITQYPKVAFYILSQNFIQNNITKGIHQTAIIGENCSISQNAYIGPNTIIEDNVKIGENVLIKGNSYIYSNTIIEENVTVESNCSIGATGLFWTWDKTGKMWQLPQLGGVIIKCNSFLGTDITIVRSAYKFSNTLIGRNCKIAHGSKIGHDCQISDSVHLANNVTLGGSTTIKERCFIGSAATFRAGITIEKDNVIGAGALVTKSFKCEKSLIIGFPAKEKVIEKKLSGMNDPLHRIK